MAAPFFWTVVDSFKSKGHGLEWESRNGNDNAMTEFLPAFVPDDAKRFADIVNGYVAFVNPDELHRKWLAVRLSDGGTDGTLYDSKRDAVRHQLDEFLCCYFSFRNCMNGISPSDAQRYMEYNRLLYKGGARMPDPDRSDGGLDPFLSVSAYDQMTGRIRSGQRQP
jgi:hypothetical protein